MGNCFNIVRAFKCIKCFYGDGNDFGLWSHDHLSLSTWLVALPLINRKLPCAGVERGLFQSRIYLNCHLVQLCSTCYILTLMKYV